MDKTTIEFNAISDKIMKLDNLKIEDDDKLTLYGYYKQATHGDCDISSPSFFDYTNTAKYNAWNKNKGMNKQTSMQRYIIKAKLLMK